MGRLFKSGLVLVEIKFHNVASVLWQLVNNVFCLGTGKSQKGMILKSLFN